ncbi:porin [Vibrio sp. ZSDE26]|uniref:Porin n=1 Tax=Vibrio amylolyticus TaxID=2847292 RepID=A0A9X1XN25_9VIBR|nr:porin [Vibrio amylolyticus]MCK6262479.1 porin [Vibrio amylolyticus]
MKKTLTSIAVACSLATAVPATVSAHEVYRDGARSLHLGGRLFTLYQGYDETKLNSDGTINDTYEGNWSNMNARINVYGERQLSADLKFAGFFEREFSADENDEQRALWIGVESQEYGRLTFGREENVLWNVRPMADIVTESIFDGRRIVGAQDGENWWNDNTIAYKVWKEKFDFSAAYVLPDGNSKEGVTSFNMSGKYKTDFGLDIGLGYVYGREKSGYSWDDSNSYNMNETQHQYWAGLQYRIGSWTLGGVASIADIEDKSGHRQDEWFDFEVAATYDINQWTIGAVYAQRNTEEKGTTTDFKQGKYSETDAINYGATYHVTDHFKIFGVLAFNDADKSEDTKWHLGIEYYL